MSGFRKSSLGVAAGALMMAASAPSIQAGGIRNTESNGEASDWKPSGKGHGAPDTQAPERRDPGTGEILSSQPGNQASKATIGATVSDNTISYHGGPLIDNGTNVYYIWYGNWTGNTATTILTDLAQNIGGSPRYNINTTYRTSVYNIINSVSYGGYAMDNYSMGADLTDAEVSRVVTNAIGSGKLPYDENGVYFVLSSADVKESSGFCTSYCGWHNYTATSIPGVSIPGTTIKYAFVGNPDQCPNACERQTGRTPNGNAGADGMASIIVHELEEAVTDPQLTGWYDGLGRENSDKCLWTYGTAYRAPNGSIANIKLGARNYLIQQNWANAIKGTANGYCTMSY